MQPMEAPGPQLDTKVSAVVPILQNEPLTEIAKRIRAKREIYNSTAEVKVPARFKIGDTVMTKEGAALVHGMDKKKGFVFQVGATRAKQKNHKANWSR